MLADWGATAPGAAGYVGGRTRLYVNAGGGHFTDATAAQMPAALVGWSWELTLADVDGDWALDVLVACKACTGSYLFHNDGTGHFADRPGALPPRANNYALEPMDVDGDGDLDLATINDGAGSRNRLLVNDGAGTFTDETATRLPGATNPREDDNAAVFLDVDSDGDADLLIASLSGPERLLLNDGHGVYALAPGAATPDDTPGSLGIGVADLDGDGRLDVVQSQGEVAAPEKVQLGTAAGVAIDTAPPVIAGVQAIASTGGVVHARVHDHQSPSRAHDWKRVWLVTAAGTEQDLRWAGEYLWRGEIAGAPALTTYRVCAQDRRGNETCSAPVTAIDGGDGGGGDGGDGGGGGGDGGPGDGAPGDEEPGGCCSADARGPRGGLALAGLVLALGRAPRRRRRRITA